MSTFTTFPRPFVKVFAVGNCAEPIYTVTLPEGPDGWLAAQPGFIHLIAPGQAQFYGVDAACAVIDAAWRARLPRPGVSSDYNAHSAEEAERWGCTPAPTETSEEMNQRRDAILAALAQH